MFLLYSDASDVVPEVFSPLPMCIQPFTITVHLERRSPLHSCLRCRGAGCQDLDRGDVVSIYHPCPPKGGNCENLTSPVLSLALCSLSISMTCCSSTKAIAHGTPTMSALAVRIHKPLPPHRAPPLTRLANCDVVLEIRRRVLGETMSRSARIRSDMVSDGKADETMELVEREESAGEKKG